MTDERMADERRGHEAVAALPRVAADAAFRHRLREAFVSGELAAEAPGPARARPRRRAWLLVPLALAAGIVLALLAQRQASGPAVAVIQTSGEGHVSVDGVTIPVGEASALATRLRPGIEVATTDGAQVTLDVGGRWLLVLTPGTRMTLPADAGTRRVQAHFHAGEARITTGPRFAGDTIEIATSETLVTVTGTTLAVIRNADGTCVCVLEGTVAMREGGRAATPVHAGTRRVVPSLATPPYVEAILPMEQMKLDMLADQGAKVLGGAP